MLLRRAHDRIVKCFVKFDEAMKPGDSVELLTDYGKPYEDVRVRKGYHSKNIHRGDKSDDQVFGARMKRNFALRFTTEEMCAKLSLPDLSRILD